MFIHTISFNIVYVACQVGNYLNEYVYFFDNLKETFKFQATGCHVKGPLPPPPPHRTERQVITGGGGRDMAGPIFPP